MYSQKMATEFVEAQLRKACGSQQRRGPSLHSWGRGASGTCRNPSTVSMHGESTGPARSRLWDSTVRDLYRPAPPWAVDFQDAGLVWGLVPTQMGGQTHSP